MKKILLAFGALFAPLVAMAQAMPRFGYIQSGVSQLYTIVNSYLIPVLMLAAFGFFLWGVIGYIRADSEDAKKKSRHTLIQGTIALAVIVSVWGLVALLQNIFGVNAVVTPNIVCPPGFIARGANCFPQ